MTDFKYGQPDHAAAQRERAELRNAIGTLSARVEEVESRILRDHRPASDVLAELIRLRDRITDLEKTLRSRTEALHVEGRSRNIAVTEVAQGLDAVREILASTNRGLTEAWSAIDRLRAERNAGVVLDGGETVVMPDGMRVEVTDRRGEDEITVVVSVRDSPTEAMACEIMTAVVVGMASLTSE